jgi:hypothetical protein
MHPSTRPVKMAGTLQRQCANRHLRLLQPIFVVWFFTVKQGSARGMFELLALR